MNFQIFIKNNLEEQNHFGSGKRYDLNQNEIIIGSDKSCTCVIEDKEVKAQQIKISQKKDVFHITACDDSLVFVNDQPLQVNTPVKLETGSEIRIGHWICLFHKVLPKASYSHGALFLSRSVKIIVAIVIIIEIGIITLGTAWINVLKNKSSILDKAQKLQYINQQVDNISRTIKAEVSKTNLSEVELLTYQAIDLEITKIRNYVGINVINTPSENLDTIQQLLLNYQTFISKLQTKVLFAPIPKLILEEKIKESLEPMNTKE